MQSDSSDFSGALSECPVDTHSAAGSTFSANHHSPGRQPCTTVAQAEFLIQFEAHGNGEKRAATVALDLQRRLQRELDMLSDWIVRCSWTSPEIPSFQVIVSDRFRISKSLVPAWFGQRGRIELPARRVAAREAAILHELVHVLLPNANRFLAEGLAVFLQATLGGNRAFPNYGAGLHELAARCLRNMPAESIADETLLPQLDSIATPAPLTLAVGATHYDEGQRGQSHIYPLVGSFVQHLVEAHGVDPFQTLYQQTPFVPARQHAGDPDRWIGVYGVGLGALERQWKTRLRDR